MERAQKRRSVVLQLILRDASRRNIRARNARRGAVFNLAGFAGDTASGGHERTPDCGLDQPGRDARPSRGSTRCSTTMRCSFHQLYTRRSVARGLPRRTSAQRSRSLQSGLPLRARDRQRPGRDARVRDRDRRRLWSTASTSSNGTRRARSSSSGDDPPAQGDPAHSSAHWRPCSRPTSERRSSRRATLMLERLSKTTATRSACCSCCRPACCCCCS